MALPLKADAHSVRLSELETRLLNLLVVMHILESLGAREFGSSPEARELYNAEREYAQSTREIDPDDFDP